MSLLILPPVSKLGLQICKLNSPKTFNAFNDAMYNQLTEALQDAVANDFCSGFLLTGDGVFFSAGADLSNGSTHNNNNNNNNNNLPNIEYSPVWKFMHAVMTFPKLLLAAVNGRGAIGIGVTLLLHFDLVYTSASSKFWIPFTRLALVPEFGVGHLLPKICGRAKANRLLLLGEEIGASEAVEFGICSTIVPNSENVCDRLQSDVESKLLALPHGSRTAGVFVDLIRTRTNRTEGIEKIVMAELCVLRERFARGEVSDAAKVLMNRNKSKSKRTSKL